MAGVAHRLPEHEPDVTPVAVEFGRRELPDALKEVVAGCLFVVARDNERLVDQAKDRLKNSPRFDLLLVGDHRFDSTESERRHEQAQPCEDQLKGFVEKFVGPAQRRLECLVSPWHTAIARSQPAKTLVEQFRDIGWAHRPSARGSQLDRQRNVVEAVADLNDGILVVGVEVEVIARRARSP